MIEIMIEETTSEIDTKAMSSHEMMSTIFVTELMSAPMMSE